MPSADPVTVGMRVADARTRAGLTQAQLAAAVSMDRSALAKVESGRRRVSAVELARIAEEVGERIEWFVLDAPPAIVSHRNVKEPGTASPRMDREVERVARSAEFVVTHDDSWAHAEPPPMNRPDTVEQAEAAAAAARRLLGLDPTQPFLDTAARAAGIGLLTFGLDLGSEAADAASILLPQGGVALVNGHLHVGRRRLAFAHELGHYLFADDYTVDWRIAEQDDASGWEARLDRFARAVLLPPGGLGRMWQDLHGGGDLREAAVRTASAFRVDMSTLARRLRELGHVDGSDAARIRAVRTTRADIVEMNLLVNDELAPPSLPRKYEEAVLRLYRREVVSAARAVDLLLDTWDEDELPPLPPLDRGALWKFVS